MSDETECPACEGEGLLWIWPCGVCHGPGMVIRSNEMTTLSNVLAEVRAEFERATLKFPTWPTDPLHALAVLGEEYGELNKAMLQLMYEPEKSSHKHVREEAIQTAAMALRLICSLDQYDYTAGQQHQQSHDAAQTGEAA
ncbi:hypothetical protein [Thalassospira xiamenensis]|uniref:hypothetical protein n=1 Tax=Thalassospira xiamenensis TaxID=220697 RepID=UPI0007A52A0E|nr:hypothetical protein [Thalassospira xiamenensis]